MMSYVRSPEFAAKKAAYQDKAGQMREMHARQLFDVETEETESVMAPQEAINRILKD